MSANARTEFFVTPECRFVYPYLDMKRATDWQNKPIPADKQGYEVTILVPKTAADPQQCHNYKLIAAKLWECIAAQQSWKGQWRQGANWPLLDCDQINQRSSGQPETEPFATKNQWARGHWRFRADSSYPPRVVDYLNNDIAKGIDGRFVAFKGGDFGMASVNVYAYDTGVGGLGFGIEGVKKTRDGDPIGGGQRSPEQMFGGPAPSAAAPPLPPGYGAPPASTVPQHAGYGAAPPQPVYAAPAGGPPSGFQAPQAAPPAASPYAAHPALTGRGNPQTPPSAPYPPVATNGAYPSNGAPVYGGTPPQPGYPPAPQGGMPPAPPFGQR